MICKLIIEVNSDYDKQINQLHQAAKEAKPEDPNRGYSHEEAIAKQALDAKYNELKNKSEIIIHHGGSYTTIGLAGHSSSRVALITYEPGEAKEEYVPYGKEWEDEMTKWTVKQLKEQWDMEDFKGKKIELIRAIAAKLKTQEAWNKSNSNKEEEK